MWALLNSDNTINKILTRPKALSIGDVNYPANIFSMWTSAELEALKIYEVVVDNTNFKIKSIILIQIKPLHLQVVQSLQAYGTATAKL